MYIKNYLHLYIKQKYITYLNVFIKMYKIIKNNIFLKLNKACLFLYIIEKNTLYNYMIINYVKFVYVFIYCVYTCVYV